jgi:hypothetical protein
MISAWRGGPAGNANFWGPLFKVLLRINTTLEILGSSFGLRRVSCRTLPVFMEMSHTLSIMIMNPKDAQKMRVANALSFGPLCDQHRGAFFCLWVVSRRPFTTATQYTTRNLSPLPTSSLTPCVGHSTLMTKKHVRRSPRGW